jgi:putative hydrolase of the HAD superfamily
MPIPLDSRLPAHPASIPSGTIEAGVPSTIHGAWEKQTLALRAVIFDYGMVLTGPQDPAAHAELMRITGLPPDRFEALYWADRHAYDEGKLTGVAFWEKFLRASGLHASSVDPATIVAELNRLDAHMWTTQNPIMLAWQLKLKQHGLLTAILSNMGDNVLENMKREFDWLPRFDVLVWSYQLRMAKPEPAIYHHVLKELGVLPEEALFLDDKLINIEAAHALGMQAIQFSTVEKLREDLVSAGLDAQLPLP